MSYFSQNSEVETIQPTSVIALIGSSFLFPFRLSHEPINRLLVVDVKDDAEYLGLEPQMFDDSISGRGLRILMSPPRFRSFSHNTNAGWSYDFVLQRIVDPLNRQPEFMSHLLQNQFNFGPGFPVDEFNCKLVPEADE